MSVKLVHYSTFEATLPVRLISILKKANDEQIIQFGVCGLSLVFVL